MKLIILQEKFKSGLTIVERLTGKSINLPILNNILIVARKNFLSLITTDLEIGIKWWSLAKVEKEGEIVIPSRLLSHLVNFFPNKQILLEKKDKFLEIRDENFQVQIKGFPTEDFPIIPEVAKENYIEIEAIPLCQSLKQLVDIASPSQARPEIAGIFFSFQKDGITLAATDSFRLGEKTIFWGENFFSEKEVSFILPQKAAREVINIFDQFPGKLKIYFSSNQVLFESEMVETPHPQVQLFTRLIEGDYPSYKEIIPKKFQSQIILVKEEFLNQIKIASLFSSKINEIKFKIDPKKNTIEILSQNPNLGQYQSFLTGKIKGEPLEISFNHRFLIDGLLKIKNTEVSFEFSGQEGPAVLKPVDDPSYLYVVMPIKAS